MLISLSSSTGGRLLALATTAVTLLSPLGGVHGRLSAPSGSGIAKKDMTLEDRALFELPSPFNSFNERCEDACLHGDEFPIADVVEPLPMACPKCPEAYTPCNSCCYGGASSLKLRFFACPGTLSFATPDQLVDDCDDYSIDATASNLTAVHFVDCECFANATGLSDIGAVIDASATCTLYEELPLDYNTMDMTVDYFEICLVATSRNNTMDDFMLDLSVPLPEVIGLLHDPYFDNIAGIDDPTILGTTVTYFDTTCFPKVDGAHGNLAYPLFPGYGKFAATCPDFGFIDFGQTGITPLPDAIDHFDGIPPSTSFYYEFVDGTSVGFWPDDVQDMIDEDIFFLPNFATCACRDCDDDLSHAPSSSPTITSSSAPTATSSNAPTVTSSSNPTIADSSAPSALSSASPSGLPSVADSSAPTISAFPSKAPSNSPSLSAYPSVAPSNSGGGGTPTENDSENPR
jgi:hypothetical protein